MSHPTEPVSSNVGPIPANRNVRGRFPPIWVWTIVGLCVGLIIYIRSSDVIGDHGTMNIVTLVFGFLAFLAVALWFGLFSGFARATRVSVSLLMVGSIALFFVLFRIEHVSGEMIPSFRLRFAPPRDATLAKPVVASSPEDAALGVSHEHDFPQFLGPERNAWLEKPKLSRDWKSQPPRTIWRQAIGAGWSAFSAVNGYAVTMEQRGEDELVTCYRIATGELVWSHAENRRHETVLGGVGPRSTPTIHDGKVYTLGPTGLLLCLDGANGDVVWREDLLVRYQIDPVDESSDIAWGRAASVLIADNMAIVPVGGSREKRVSLAAFDRISGDLLWEGGNRQVSYSSPAHAELAGRRQILIVNESSASGHDVDTGKLLWEYDWPGNSNAGASASQAVAVPPNRVFLSKGYGQGSSLIELISTDGQLRPQAVWKAKNSLKTKLTNVGIRQGHVYGLSDGILECVELETGKRRWKRGRYGQGQILGVGDLILVQAETGEVILVEANPQAHVELGRFQAIEGKTWNNLCLYGPYLLVRNAEEAACYQLAIE